jgi:hypothetical protein
MKYFPAVCIDDFYSDPNSVKEFDLKFDVFLVEF